MFQHHLGEEAKSKKVLKGEVRYCHALDVRIGQIDGYFASFHCASLMTYDLH